MRWFALGFLLVITGATAALDVHYFRTEFDPGWIDRAWASQQMMIHTLSLALAPWIGAVAGALLLHAARPMRLFADRGRRRSAKLALGAASAIATAGMILLALPLADGRLPDSAVAGVCALLASVAVLFTACRRDRAGDCLGCGYDLRGSRLSGKCPECGRACAPAHAPAGA